MTNLIQALIDDPDRTNAVAAIANVALATLALIVAIASIALSLAALRRQTLHNKLSVRPIPFIACADYLERIAVKIFNNGTGPFIVNKITVLHGDEVAPDIISWMPELPEDIFWSNFTISHTGRSVQHGNELNLIELEGSPDDPGFVAFRNKCRSALKDLTVVLDYTDIYGDRFPTCTRTLELFAR